MDLHTEGVASWVGPYLSQQGFHHLLCHHLLHLLLNQTDLTVRQDYVTEVETLVVKNNFFFCGNP